jgi:hypothetical protein
MTILHYSPKDFVALAVIAVFGAGIIVLNRLGIGYTM